MKPNTASTVYKTMFKCFTGHFKIGDNCINSVPDVGRYRGYDRTGDNYELFIYQDGVKIFSAVRLNCGSFMVRHNNVSKIYDVMDWERILGEYNEY